MKMVFCTANFTTQRVRHTPDHCERVSEIHHIIPISQYNGQKITNLDDLAVLFANCHRAIHTFSNDQMPSVDEFRQQLQQKTE